MAFAIGDAVVHTHMQESRIGEVVSVLGAGPIAMYDVSFERERRYALLESELEPAGEAQIRAVAAGLTLQDGAASESGLAPTPDHLRDQWLRKRYLTWLTDLLERGKRGTHAAISGRFEPHEAVCVMVGDEWFIGTVVSISLDAGETYYDLEVEGEIERHPESSLSPLSKAKAPGQIPLGSRVRFVAVGHGDDPDFEGIVSRVQSTPEGCSYSLAFDDGDIFEGLSPHELLVLNG